MNISKNSFAALAVAIGLLCLPQITAAQLSDTAETARIQSDTSRVYSLGEIIVTASRYEQDPQTVGRSIAVIDQQEIEESLHLSVAELLGEQPGFHMIGGGQTPGSLQQGFIRNANNHHSVVMVDGVRISDPSTVTNSVDLSELSLSDVKRIEIVRGSHSTLYGSSAIGGVVNLITKDRAQSGFNADLNSRHGTFGDETYVTQNNLHMNYSLSNGLYANFGLSQQLSNGLDATIDTVSTPGSFNPQDSDGFRKLDLKAKAGYRTKNSDIYFSYRNANQSSELDQGAYRDDDNAESDFMRNLFAYGASHRFNENIQLRYEGAYSGLQRNFVNDSSQVDQQGSYDGTYVETNAEGTSWENSLTARAGIGNIEIIGGIESSIQTMSTRNYVFSRSSFGVFEQTTDLDSLDLKERISAAFLHSELNGGFLSESLKPFSLVVGGRITHHNEFGSHFTFEVNPKVRLSTSSLLYGAITTGFNAPSLYQLNTPEQGAGAYTSRGNPNLEPEKSMSFEIGWRQEVGDILDIELSLYRTTVDDVIEYVYLWNGDTTVADLTSADYFGDTYINISQQDIKGVEFGLNLRPTNTLSLGGTLSLGSSKLTFAPDDIDREYVGNNSVQVYESGVFINDEEELEGLTRRPEASATLRASYRPFPAFLVGITSRFVGSRDDVFYSASLGPFGAQDRNNLDGYNLTDLRINYKLSNRFSVTGKVENLFNTRYTEIIGYRTKGRGLLLEANLKFR